MLELVKLTVLFLLMVIILKLTKLLPLAIGCAAVAAVPLFHLTPLNALTIAGKSLISPLTLTTLAAFYFITFLQRTLEKRGKLSRAQEALNGIFNNRRINASLAPMMIGLLPAAGVVTIAGAIVDKNVGDSLSVEEKTFVSTYYRHVAESFVPTFPSIIIGVELSGVALSSFLLGMLPVAALIIWLGFVFHLRKVPKSTGGRSSANKGKEIAAFFYGLWPIFVIVLVVIIFKTPVYLAVAGIAIISIFIDRFTWSELKPMFISACEPKLLLSMAVIFIFKDILIAAGVIATLPGIFSNLPLPSFVIYTIIIFLGSLISGQQAINIIVLPMAFAAGGGGGVPLFILLMVTGYAAMQISPTHICLAIVCDYFKVPMGALVKKTLPVVMTLLALVLGYYFLLEKIF